MNYLKIETERTGYAVDQISRTMKVGELKAFLEDMDDDMPIYLSFDNGYTYGGLQEENFEEVDSEE